MIVDGASQIVMGNSHKRSADLNTPPPTSTVVMANGSGGSILGNGDITMSNCTLKSDVHTKNGSMEINNPPTLASQHPDADEQHENITPNPEINIPLPKQMHLTLAGPELERRPFVVIGDVHGCLDELQELVAMVRAKAPGCVFLFCGDIVNKGPKSLETLRYVRALGGDAYVVRGNHEEHTLHRWLRWKQHPDVASPPLKKFSWSTALLPDEAAWLQELPYTISVPHINAIIVHAGFVPGRPLDQQQPWDMTEMRDMVGAAPSKQRVGVAWASLWEGPQHVYFGHDARRRLQQHAYATGLDTGCVFGGLLTAQFLTGPGREMVRVQARQPYKKAKSKQKPTDGDNPDAAADVSDD